MPNINAALLVAQLENLDKFITNKRKIASSYEKFFKEIEYTFFKEPVHSRSNYWLNTLIFKDRQQRDKFLEETNNKGVMTRPIWQLMNKLEMFKDCQCTDLENAKYLEERSVCIPSSSIF